MTTLSIQPPFPPFADRAGAPLQNGYIWIGAAAMNPITNPIAVYWDAALTQAAAQPIRTQGGYPVNNGTPARLYVGSDYSILVQDSKGTLVYQAPNATERWSDVVVTAIDSSKVTFLQAGTGAQTRTAQSKLRDAVSVKDFGAVGNGSADDTAAIQAAITANVGPVYFPSGTYLITDTITIDTNRPHLIGAGVQKSIIKFNPSSAKPCFNFDQGANSVVQAHISGFGFTSDNSNNKTAIRIRDGRHCVVEDIGIAQGAWLGTGSICLHVLGRDTMSVGRFAVLCARPILIDVNPNFATLHTDHFHFYDLEIGSTLTAGSSIEIADGVNISSLTFDGYQAWLLGKYGLYWNDTTSGIASHNVTIENARVEQGSDPTGYSIYMASTAQNLQSVTINNCYFDSARNGVYFRKADNISIEDTFFAATSGTSIDITFQQNTQLAARNMFVNAGPTITLTNAVPLQESFYVQTTNAAPATATWIFDQNALISRGAQRFDGVPSFKWYGEMADVTQINLPVRAAGGVAVAVWHLAVAGSTKFQSATGAYKPGSTPTLLSNTADVVTSSTLNKFAIVDASNGLSLINRLGETVDVVIEVTWAN